jgi:hypothetical protein
MRVLAAIVRVFLQGYERRRRTPGRMLRRRWEEEVAVRLLNYLGRTTAASLFPRSYPIDRRAGRGALHRPAGATSGSVTPIRGRRPARYREARTSPS